MAAMHKKTLCVDFDGVIHSYASGWQGESSISDPPVPNAFEFLFEALNHFKVAIYSSRSATPQGIKAMQNYVAIHACRIGPPSSMWWLQLEWPVNKPAAHLTLDDRAITFTGAWPSMAELLNFEPWYKKPPQVAEPGYAQAALSAAVSLLREEKV